VNELETLANTVHDAIDTVTTAVEGIHRSIADLPLDVLAGFGPFSETFESVKAVQAQSIGVVYELVRDVNDRVRRITTAAAG
jgi:hypothetical protein